MSVQPGTPLPWQIVRTPHATGERRNIVDAKRHPVAVADASASASVADLNAAYIVTACNSFPELVAALDKYADDLCEGWCEQSPDCAHFDDCGGCLARRVAWEARGRPGEVKALSALEVGGGNRG